ncbi:hypothetical protein BGZ46_003458 [Entomortierella lignicola]|nr:hypothetical protein BGZ46_003458 [Entomortierella lignicola]
MDSSFSQFNGSNSNNINDHQQSGSNNSFLGTSSQDSLGSSLSRHGSTGNTPRRASFNLSTGSLRNFNSGASPSLASPSSPSYSTIAVARARAAAAATAAATAGATEGGSGSSQGAGRDGLGIVGSGVFPGGGALGQNSFSSAPSSSSSTSSSVPSSSDLYLNSKQPSNSYESNGVPQPNSLGSSASSLTSNDSVLNGGMATATAGSSTSPLPASSLPTSQSHHLQDNANAERQISMILDNFLYLGGDLVDEEQIDELERLGIKRVLNMAINCDDLLWIKRAGKDNGSYLKVGLLDHVDQDLKAGLDIATKFIGSSSSPVYVHCQAGKSRSVATVIGYLIQEHKWPLKKAYDHVVERRRIMSPNIGFVSQLIMLEERVLGPEKAGGLVSTANSDEELDPASRTTVVPWMNS